MTEQEKSKEPLPEEQAVASTKDVAQTIKKVKKETKPKKKDKKDKAERKRKVDRDEVKKALKKMGLTEVAKKFKISTTYAWRIKTGRFRD